MSDAKRQSNGQFGPGNTANPGGRPKIPDEFKRKCAEVTDSKVYEAWVDEMELRQRIVAYTKLGQPIYDTARGPNWMKASENLAAYGKGRPVQPTENKHAVSGDGETPVRFTVRLVKPGQK